MDDPAILFVKPKAIRTHDKKVLREAGVLVIEMDDPKSAKFVRVGVELDGGALLTAAATAIKASDSQTKSTFAEAICAAIDALQDPTPAL